MWRISKICKGGGVIVLVQLLHTYCVSVMVENAEHQKLF